MRRGTQLRGAGLLVAAVTSVVVLAGCGAAPPGTAAEVGDARIDVSTLQSEVDAVLAYRSSAGLSDVRDQLPALTQQVLSADVVHELTADAAARAGVTADVAAVDAQLAQVTPDTLAQPSLSFLTPDTLRGVVTDQVVITQLGAAAWDGLAVDVDITVAADEGAARAKAQRMASGAQASADVVAEDTAAGLPAQAGLALSPATAPGLAGYPVFTEAEGSAVAFPYKQQWQVARVVSRRTDAPASTAGGATSAAQAGPAATYSLGLTLLPQLAGDPDVVVSPRYGVWDPTGGQVVDAGAEPSAVVVPPART